MTLLRQIEAGIEQGTVKAHLVRKTLADKDLDTRGIGYAVMAEGHMRALMIEFKPKSGDPIACFDYLLDCIAADLDWDEDYAHTREDALYELGGVLDPFWAKAGVGFDQDVFWVRVSDVMRTLDAQEVAIFLEGCVQDQVYMQAMTTWASDPILATFVPE